MSADLDLKVETPDLHTEFMMVNVGPSHPLTHGTVRFVLTLDGETIVKCDTEVGYLHRGFEKEVENATWSQVFPYTDRLNYVSPLLNNFGFALAVEKLMGVEVPARCNYIRTIMGELARMSDHFTCIAAGGLELGAFTAFLYAIEAREEVWDLIEAVTGARLTSSYGRIGGLAFDLLDDFDERWRAARVKIDKVIGDVDRLLTKNRIYLDRMEGTGVLSPQDAIAWGYTGPILRSTGVDYDLRKDKPYFAYGEVDFEVPVGTRGDNMDRYLVRLAELRQSCRIIDQGIANLPDGAWRSDDARCSLPDKERVYNSIEGMMNHFKIIFEGIEVPAGEVYSYTEAGNGELGFFIVSDGSGQPWRIKVRAPSFYHMGALDRLVEGGMIADIIPTFDTINMIGGEIDR